jgi:putative addiction module killer protein
MVLLFGPEVLEYLDRRGRSPYGAWFDSLHAEAAVKVAVAVTRLAQGNFSTVKGVGGGVFECRVNFGPGFRVYFGKDGDSLIILLGGGSKKKQREDIDDAVDRWQDYKKRRKRE